MAEVSATHPASGTEWRASSTLKRSIPRRRGLRRSIARTALLLSVWAVGWLTLQTFCAGSTLEIRSAEVDKEMWQPQRVLLLTAHPDDEVMFFAPVITALVRMGIEVWGLCLSQGNADGLGYLRRLELERAYEVLGVPLHHIQSLDHPNLQDGMEETWDPSLIASLVQAHVEKDHIDTVVSFDGHGISFHPNHIACFHALQSGWSQRVTMYSLTSVSLYMKYLGSAHAILHHIRERTIGSLRGRRPLHASAPPLSLSFLSTPAEYRRTLAAMRMHASQLVWFRYLYLLTSTYMHGATLTLI